MPDAKTTQTIAKSVREAYNLVSQANIWIGIGKTSEWPDESDPPDPDIAAQNISEIVGLVKPDQVKIVVPDKSGAIEFPGSKWRMLIPPYNLNDLINQGARWVYVSGWLLYEQFPVVEYRQECVYADVIKAVGVPPGATVLLSGQVESYGTMLIYTNRVKVIRSESKKEFIEFIIEC